MKRVKLAQLGFVLALAVVAGCSIKERGVEEVDAGASTDGGGRNSGSGGKGSGTGGKNGSGSGGAGNATGGKSGATGTGGKTGSGGSASGSGGRTGTGGATPPGAGGKGSGGATPPGTGGTGGSGQAGAPQVDVHLLDTFTQLASTQCQKLAECAPFAFDVGYGTLNNCITRLMLEYSWEAGLEDTALTAAKVEACRSATANLDCRTALGAETIAACDTAGTRSNGAACNSRIQCASRYCDTSGYDCGTCATALTAGASCGGDGQCASGLGCLAGECVRIGKLGDSCSASAPCDTTLNCVGGYCAAAPNTVGASCDPSNGVYCDLTQGLICSGSPMACAKATASDTCNAGEYCQGGTYCDPNTSNCLPSPSDTGACDPSANKDCRFPAVCVSGYCQLPGSVPSCR